MSFYSGRHFKICREINGYLMDPDWTLIRVADSGYLNPVSGLLGTPMNSRCARLQVSIGIGNSDRD